MPEKLKKEYVKKKKSFWRMRCECGCEYIVRSDRIKTSKGCRNCTLPKGKKNGRWNGGKNVNKNGYVSVHAPKHPYRTKRNTVLEHRLVMEKKLGRYLKKDEHVHHINGNRSDNRIENLELWTGAHPSGARAKDLVKWAKEIIKRYEKIS